MIKLINNTLDQILVQYDPDTQSLIDGARYAVLGQGKRIRPLITLYTTEALHKPSCLQALQPACALEVTHCYSLVHDDLPCLDNDDFRRGKPSLHKIYDEGHALLIGNYLLTLAFDLLTTSPHLTDQQRINCIQTLSQASGSDGLIGGQIMDIEQNTNTKTTNCRKTGALFQCAFLFGGIVASAEANTLTQLRNCGYSFGELFQMVDDMIDGKEQCDASFYKTATQLHSKLLEQMNELFPTSPQLTSFANNLVKQVHEQMKKTSLSSSSL